MTTLTEGAFAKINLTLDVLDRREDGYHDIRSILQTVALRDDIELLLDTGTGWRIECETAGIPLDETNLAWRAARVFFDTFGGEPDGLTIRITKRIPSGQEFGRARNDHRPHPAPHRQQLKKVFSPGGPFGRPALFFFSEWGLTAAFRRAILHMSDL